MNNTKTIEVYKEEIIYAIDEIEKYTKVIWRTIKESLPEFKEEIKKLHD